MNQLVTSGWATDFCVDSMVRSAVSRRYAVVIVEDGHTLADLPHLDSAKVIERHNWVRTNITTPGPAVTVMSSAANPARSIGSLSARIPRGRPR